MERLKSYRALYLPLTLFVALASQAAVAAPPVQEHSPVVEPAAPMMDNPGVHPTVAHGNGLADLHIRSLPALPHYALPPDTSPVRQHAFWDRNNRLLFAGVGLMRALDYASTRNMQARGREEILLPDDVVNNSAGFAALEAAGTATSIGLSYLMHRTKHHKIERWISIVHIGVAGFGDIRNYALKSKHPVTGP
jgi:hypothetical protein